MLKKIFNRLSLSGFATKEDGNIFITTALIAPLLVIAVGVGVDTAEIYRARVNFQNAVDAGTLTVAKIIAREGATPTVQARAKTAGTNVFKANMRNLDQTKADIQFIIDPTGCAAGGISATATLDHRVFFDAWHKVSDSTGLADHAKLTAETEVQCGNTTLEIALVLDNSGSMEDPPSADPTADTKIETLKKAAGGMVSTLHTSFGKLKGVSDPLQFSVVPFSTMVNVGDKNDKASWMDTDGLSSIHHENFNWDLDPNAAKNGFGGGYKDLKGKKLTRFTLYKNLGLKWKGCVESRPYPLLTDDSEPAAADPDSLVVPSFAPDTPSSWNSWYYPEEWYWNDYLNDAHNFPTSLNAYGPYALEYRGTAGNRQYKRMKWAWKYFKSKKGKKPKLLVAEKDGGGPNNGCNSVPLSELTTNQKTTEKALKKMVAFGATNIQQGAIWGWRTLSDGAPFSQGRSNDTSNNKKIMIIMTDGENTYYPTRYWGYNVSQKTRSTYGAYGLAVNRRIFAEDGGDSGLSDTFSNYTASMNGHLVETCTNAKADGIEIYTIAFDVNANSPTRKMLEECASNGPTGRPLYYEAENSTDLTETFKAISENLSQLRITR